MRILRPAALADIPSSRAAGAAGANPMNATVSSPSRLRGGSMARQMNAVGPQIQPGRRPPASANNTLNLAKVSDAKPGYGRRRGSARNGWSNGWSTHEGSRKARFPIAGRKVAGYGTDAQANRTTRMPIHFNAIATDHARHIQTGGKDANGQMAERRLSSGSGTPCRHCLQYSKRAAWWRTTLR